MFSTIKSSQTSSSKNTSTVADDDSFNKPPELSLKSVLMVDPYNKNFTTVSRKIRRNVLATTLPTRLEEWTKYGAGQFGTCPDDGIPQWKELALSKKLFARPCPPNTCLFYRQKVGRSLWPKKVPCDFRLYDMHGHSLKLSYEDVHDPHLRDHLQNKTVQQMLKHQGELYNNRVICNVKRINQHREFLRQMNMAVLRDEIRKQEDTKRERLQLQQIYELMRQRMEHLEKRQMINEARMTLRQQLDQTYKDYLQRIRITEKSRQEKINKLYQKRVAENNARIRSNLTHKSRIHRNLLLVQMLRADKLSSWKRKFRERDQRRKNNLETQIRTQETMRRNEIADSWNSKIDAMTKKMESDMINQAIWMEMLKKNEEVRKKRAESAKRKQATLIDKLREKQAQRKTRVDADKFEIKMIKTIIQAWMSNVEPGREDIEYYRIVKSINIVRGASGLRHTRGGSVGGDRYTIMMLSRMQAEKESLYPVDVSYAIDCLLEKAITNWAHKLLTAVISGALEQVVEYGLDRIYILYTRIRGGSRDTPCARKISQRESNASTLRKNSTLSQPVWDLRASATLTPPAMSIMTQESFSREDTIRPHKAVRMINFDDSESTKSKEYTEVKEIPEPVYKQPKLEKHYGGFKRLQRCGPLYEEDDNFPGTSKKWVEDFDHWEKIEQQRKIQIIEKQSTNEHQLSIDSDKWKSTFDGCNKESRDFELTSEKNTMLQSTSSQKSLKSLQSSMRKLSTGVQFGCVDVITQPEKGSEGLKSVKGRRLTPVPSHLELADLARAEKSPADLIPQIPDYTKSSFQHQEAFENLCQQICKKLTERSKMIMDACVEPKTRYRTMAKLARVVNANQDGMAEALAKEFLEKSPGQVFNGDLFEWVARGITRDASQCLFNIPVRVPNTEKLDLTRIMCMRNGPRYYINNIRS